MKRVMAWGLCFFAFVLFSDLSFARPLVVVDLDHTVFHTNFRIRKILSDLGRQNKIPQLEHVSLTQVLDFRLKRGESALAPFVGKVESAFKKAFYFDPSYLEFEAPMLGAQSFLSELVESHGFDLVYLTGRGQNTFFSATALELTAAHYPGFGARADLRQHVRLILKPESFEGTTSEFKLGVLQKIQAVGTPIVAIFDDSSRNLEAFYSFYGDRVLLVRVGQFGSDSLDSKVFTLENYLHGPKRDSLLSHLGAACSLLLSRNLVRTIY